MLLYLYYLIYRRDALKTSTAELDFIGLKLGDFAFGYNQVRRREEIVLVI